MKSWALALALVVLAAFPARAVTFQPTVNPLIPVQNSPLSSLPIRNNFQYIYNDEITLASLIPSTGAGTVSSVSCSPTAPVTCTINNSTTTPQIVVGFPIHGGSANNVQMSLGATTSGDVAIYDVNGNLVDGGAGGGGVTWPSTHSVVISNSTNSPVGLNGTAGQVLQFNGGSSDATAVSTLSSTVQGNITTVGTIGTGTWQGSVIQPTYLAVSTSTTPGIVQPDNTTITISGNVISAVSGGSGNVSGPASSTTNAIATYADTTGKLIQNNTGVVISSNAVIDTQAISATSTDGLALQNTTSATVGAQKWSPRLRWTGDGWKTTATAAGQLVDAIAELQPVQGAANPSFNWVLSGQINAGGYGALVTVPSGGGFNLNSGTYQIGGTQIACANLSNGATGCSTVVGTAATVNTGTSGATIPLLNGTNTWSGVQSFNSGDVALKGATSGTITLNAASTAGSNTLTLPAGTTDFSGTGGTSQVVKQTSAGGAFTVARLACADLSNASASCSTDATVATNITSGTLPTAQLPANQVIRGIEFVIDGGGSTITTGVKGFVLVPFACTITKATLLGDQSGSVVVDVWAKAFASSLPTVANTITASALPTISSAVTVQDSTLTGWTTSLAANSMVGFNVNSVTTMQRVTVILTCNAT